MSATGILQAVATIAKTTQTIVGAVLPTEGYEYLNLFVTYTKGDETGIDIHVMFSRTVDGTAHTEAEYSESSGVYTYEVKKHRFTATAVTVIPVFIGGIDFVKITQGGSNNDGTPTGTLAVAYSMA
jgi:hypothetical protein